MNSNQTNMMKFFLAILAVSMLLKPCKQQTTNATDDNKYPYCDRKIPQSLGFVGLSSYVKNNLDMCPNLKHSCCAVEDQLMIYEYWVTGNEEVNLETRLEFHRQVYSELFNKAIEVYTRAKKIMILLEGRAVSNCKVLARRILNFRIDALAPLLRSSMQHYHDFLKETYKGFYCSMCDAEKTRFIDINKKKFVVSEEFCRDIVYNSLHVLMYLHSHFSKYLNLISKFVSNCDYRGVYKPVTISSKYLFSTKADHHRMLNGCHTYRNDINWFDFCEPMCKQFNLVEFKEFLKPNVEKYRKYSRWLGNFMVKQRAAEAKDVLLNGDIIQAQKESKKAKAKNEFNEFDNHENKSRLLSSSSSRSTKQVDNQDKNKDCKKPDGDKPKPVGPEAKSEEDEDLKKGKDEIIAEEQQRFDEQLSDAMMIKEEATIYRSVQQSEIEFPTFRNSYNIEGLNFFAVGKTSMINDNTFKSVKSAVDLQKKKEIPYVLDKQTKKVKSWWSGTSYDEDDENSTTWKAGIHSFLILLLVFAR